MRYALINSEYEFAGKSGESVPTLKAIKTFGDFAAAVDYWLAWSSPSKWDLVQIETGKAAHDCAVEVFSEEELFDVAAARRAHKSLKTREMNKEIQYAYREIYYPITAYLNSDSEMRGDFFDSRDRERHAARSLRHYFEEVLPHKKAREEMSWTERSKNRERWRSVTRLCPALEEELDADSSIEEAEETAWRLFQERKAEIEEMYVGDDYRPKVISLFERLTYESIEYMLKGPS